MQNHTTWHLTNLAEALESNVYFRMTVANAFQVDHRTIVEDVRAAKPPVRATVASAGYDIFSPYDFSVAPGEEKPIFFGWAVHPEVLDEYLDNERNPITEEKPWGGFLKIIHSKRFKPRGDFFTDVAQLMLFEQLLMIPTSSSAKKKGLLFTGHHINSGFLMATVTNFTEQPVHIKAGDKLGQFLITDMSSEVQILPEVCKDETFELPQASLIGSPFIFCAKDTVECAPGKIAVVPTGIKVKLDPEKNQAILLHSAFNPLGHCFIQSNFIGLVDADYYGNSDNDGDIGFPLLNITCQPQTIVKGTPLGYATGITFIKVQEDNFNDATRTGGFGSTDADGSVLNPSIYTAKEEFMMNVSGMDTCASCMIGEEPHCN